MFEEVIDEFLNAVLFAFIGLGAMVVRLRFDILLAGAILVQGPNLPWVIRVLQRQQL